jgi:hypothetical protein
LSDATNWDDLLLEYHLNLLEAHHRKGVEVELERNSILRARSDRLRTVLRPLDLWSVTPPPANLAEKVLHRLERKHSSVSTVAAAVGLSMGRRLFRLRDLLAAAACIVLLCSIMVPALKEVRGRSRRAQCANNLSAVFSGLAVYQHDSFGSLPYAGSPTDATWLPFGAADRRFQSNSRHLYLLLRSGGGPMPEHFVCPSRSDVAPMPNVDVGVFSDFATARNISYDSLNLSGANPNLRPSPSLAYLSDSNPLFVDGRFHAEVDPNTTNSPAHEGRGQTVLTLDGASQLVFSPVYRLGGDNLWVMEGVRHYTGVESPTRLDDAFLIPGFPVTDPRFSRSR